CDYRVLHSFPTRRSSDLCVDHVVLDPVVDHTFTNTELFGDLFHGKLLEFLEWGRRDLITPTNPANDGHGVRFTLGTDMIFPIKRSEEHTSELQSRGHLVC